MRILILEDEPIIAIDLEDIVTTGIAGTECVLAANVEAGLQCVEDGVDFALIDIHLGHDRESCWPVAARLHARQIPFCFVTSSRKSVPSRYERVPFIVKPFHPSEITRIVPLAA